MVFYKLGLILKSKDAIKGQEKKKFSKDLVLIQINFLKEIIFPG